MHVPPTRSLRSGSLLPVAAVAGAAVVGRLPVLGAWWSGADWSRLAAASAQQFAPGVWPVERLAWMLLTTLGGLDAGFPALVRLLLHAVAAALVVRLAARCGLGRRRRALAGLVFAVAPLGFAPLYQAVGLGRILGAALALAAVDRWLAAPRGGRRDLLAGSLLAVAAAGCGPDALGLPLLLLACAWAGAGVAPADKPFAWAMLLLQIVGVVGVAAFAAGPDAALRLAPLAELPARLGACGWWLASPAPVPAATIRAPMAAAGGLLLAGWAAWGLLGLRHGVRWPLLVFLAGGLALAPAVLAAAAPAPGACYLALAPFGLLLAGVVPAARLGGREPLTTGPILGLLAVAATVVGFFGMESRLGARDASGLVADPLARATALSWEGCRTLRNLADRPALAGDGGVGTIVLLQDPTGASAREAAARLGERWVGPSPLHDALGGATGPRLLLGDRVPVIWANGLATAPSTAVVLVESPTGFRMWGRTPNALLYAALTDVARGRFARARAHLLRAAELGDERIVFICDEGQMIVPLADVLARREAFIDWTVGLLDTGAGVLEVAGLQDLFFNLLSRATGRPLDELTAGSHRVGHPHEPAGPTGPAKGNGP